MGDAVVTGLHWWDVPAILAHYEGRMRGGVAGWLKAHAKPGGSAVSIGCGRGRKELALVASGQCESVDAWDVNGDAIARARAAALSCGLEDRCRFYVGSWPDVPCDRRYSLAYWDMALHHMPDTAEALAWSRSVADHVCAVEYVGPSRFAFTAEQASLALGIRDMLPVRLDPHRARLWFPDPAKIKRDDPTEAADTDGLQALLGRLALDSRALGGLVYSVALRGLYDHLAGLPPGDRDMADQLRTDAETAEHTEWNLYGAYWL